jgi:DNA polymerase-3 subunit beta
LDITLQAKDLQKMCTIANQTTYKDKKNPLHSHLKISAGKDSVIRYTNQELMIDLKLKDHYNVYDVGECYLPIKRTTQFAKFEKGLVLISSKDNKTTLSSKLDKSDKNGIEIKLNIDKFDDIPQPNILGFEFELPDNFQKQISYSLKCVAQEECRPILTGVLFDYDGKELNMISCDGFWLVNVKTPISNLEPFKIVIPGNALKLVSNFMNGKIKIGYNKERVWFKSDNLLIVSQLIQGSYPTWQQLIPSNETTWTINCSAPLLQQRLNQFDQNGTNTIKMFIRDNMLILLNTMEGLEETEATILATIKGEGQIAFSKKYLLEASKIFSTMDIGMTSSSTPLKVTGDLEGVTFVIMPVFMQW